MSLLTSNTVNRRFQIFPQYDELNLSDIDNLISSKDSIPYKHLVYLLRRRSLLISKIICFITSNKKRIHARCKSAACTFFYLATGNGLVQYKQGFLDHSCGKDIKLKEQRSSVPSVLVAQLIDTYVNSEPNSSIKGLVIFFCFPELMLNVRDSKWNSKEEYCAP